MIKKYIRGHKERSSEVLKSLEELGGINSLGISQTYENRIYFINKYNNIVLAHNSLYLYEVIIECFEEIKLPETPTENKEL